MEKAAARATVHIAGEEYTLRGGESTTHIQELAGYLNKKIDEVLNHNPRLPKNRAVILAALHIADELFKLQKEYHELISMIEEEMQ